jgi:HPr kinase/phosphorylase
VITVADLVERLGDLLELEVVAGGNSLDREITVPEISSPGLVLAGFVERFVSKRLHALGETELAYLDSLDASTRRDAIETFLSYDVPCVFITKKQEIPEELLTVAEEKGVPLLRSNLSTSDFYRAITPYLKEVFSPTTKVHGSLADVYGVGLLFVGRSGIGKSECVLDLVERGHRLVADDLINVTKRGTDVLIGRSEEVTSRFMEIRGVGLVDVSALFGVRAFRQQKRIEVVVELADWDEARDVDRTGLDQKYRDILGVQIPEVVIPLIPGKNITVVSEVVALNHLLKFSGVDSAQALNEKLVRKMAEKKDLRRYLSEDYE